VTLGSVPYLLILVKRDAYQGLLKMDHLHARIARIIVLHASTKQFV
jgi:hypothetical protein